MPSKIFCIPDDLIFSRSPYKFSLFRISCQISREFAPWMPPVLHHAPVTTFFTSFLVIYLHSFKKTGPLDAPQGRCPGPSHRPHHPLYATDHLDHLEEYSFPKQLVIMFSCT